MHKELRRLVSDLRNRQKFTRVKANHKLRCQAANTIEKLAQNNWEPTKSSDDSHIDTALTHK